jgi:heterodisulfide reductase subunit A
VARIGVFVCHCGENIGRTVDVKKVAERARALPDVAFSAEYPYMCSAPGQKLIAESIREHGLTGIVVSACSPNLHEPTFRGACARAGLNPYLCEMANIREQCSWVHPDPELATAKASRIVASSVRKVANARELHPSSIPVTHRALVLGGGVAGVRAALDIANAGHDVVLVEKNPSIGGNMARLSETFPTLDCSQCILTPLMVEVSRHPRVELMTYSELEEVSGFVGNFKVKIRRKASFVKAADCTACGDCATACPVSVPNEFDRGLSWRKAIYIPFPQAVPSTFTLDAEHCVNFARTQKAEQGSKPTNGSNGSEPGSDRGSYRVLACERCADACKPRVIDYDERTEIVEREVGAIVVATGYQMQEPGSLFELGHGRYPDVVDSLELERMLSASGPTGGEVRRPSDGRPVRDIVFVQCAGSRDPVHGVPYCSRICCMYTAKHALLFKHKVHDGRATVFYIDVRAAGKGYEEFVRRVMEEERVLYVRGRVSRVTEEDGRLRVFGSDTLSGQPVQVRADLVVLATPMRPAATELSGRLRIATDANGFFAEAHPKLRPVETLSAGIFVTGAGHAPKDIPDTVAQASASASKALELLSKQELARDPATARVDESRCMACFECVRICPYQAVTKKEIRDRKGALLKTVATVNAALCEGCGACAGACRAAAMDVAGYSDAQVFAQLEALVAEGAA